MAAAARNHNTLPQVGVVGAGLIGGSIVRRILGDGRRVQVADHDPAVVAQAEDAGATVTSFAQLREDVDVAFLSVPPRAVAPLWQEWLAGASAHDVSVSRRRSVVLDVSSVKRPVIEGIERAGVPVASADAVLILSHPMAGKARGGWSASEADLFEGATWVLLPPPEATGAELARAISTVESMGATVCFMEPTFHDRFAALTSHIPHALAFTFQALVDEVDPAGWRRFSGGSLRDLLRVAGADHDLWTDILTGSSAQLAPLLRDLADRLASFDPETDIPVTPPSDPLPSACDPDDPDGGPLRLSVPLDEPLGELSARLTATGESGLHLAGHDLAGREGSLELTFGAPVASEA